MRSTCGSLPAPADEGAPRDPRDPTALVRLRCETCRCAGGLSTTPSRRILPFDPVMRDTPAMSICNQRASAAIRSPIAAMHEDASCTAGADVAARDTGTRVVRPADAAGDRAR